MNGRATVACATAVFAASVMLCCAPIPPAHADVLYSQTVHGGTRTYGPGTNESDSFPVGPPPGGAYYPDLYATLHLVNFAGNASAHQITYYASYWRDFINDTVTDGCWYVGTTSSSCVDPAMVPAAQDLTIVAHFSNAYAQQGFAWGYTITAPYTLWTDGNGGTSWTCIATTLAEAQACPIPSMLTAQNQYRADGATPIAEGGLITERAVTLSGILKGSPGDTMRMEVEVQPLETALTGNATAMSSSTLSDATATIAIANLADGDYHWAARAVDLSANTSTPWTEFGTSGNADFSIKTNPGFFLQTGDSATSQGSWYDDNWYQLGRGFAGTITSLALEGMVDSADHGSSHVWLKEFSDSNYTQLVNTYTISDNAPFAADGFKKTTFSGLNIPLDPSHYYRLDTYQDYQNRSVILKGTPGIGTAMADTFVYGTGRVEGRYAFYPYIVANGNFDEPIVIVPGVMGSRLVGTSGGPNAGHEVWPDVTDMANSGSDDYLDALKLAPDGTQIPGNEMAASDIIREATGTYNRLFIPIPLDTTVYGNLITTFTDAGYVEGQDLFVAPYDWRLSVASSAAAVGTVVQNAVAHSPNGKITIIAHSMGGLAVKDYLASVAGAASDASFVDKLIFAGAPQLGAPYIFKALQYGDDLGFTFGPFSILNSSEVKSIAQNMPGVYDLLPSRRYEDVDGGYVLKDGVDDAGNVTTQALSFNETDQFLTADPTDSRNAGLLAAADAFHASQDGVSVNTTANAPRVYNIVGCQDPTPAQYVLHDDGSIDINRTNGDGSVPVDSAMNLANGYENYFVLNSENGVDHEGLIRDSQPLALMRAIAQETTSSLALEPLGISTDTEDCLLGRGAPRPAMVEISVSGSSTVDIYDSAGNSGTGIPGSSYDTIGGNTFVTVPASSTVKITIKQASSSTSSVKTKVKVKKYDTSAHVTTTTSYADVPLATALSTATLVIAAQTQTSTTATTTPDPVLTVDEDGTGVTSTVVEPDGADTANITPPAHIPLSCAQH